MRANEHQASVPNEIQLAQDIALKAAADIATQAEFASLDAANPTSLTDAAKRFDTILHYAERALGALNRVRPR